VGILLPFGSFSWRSSILFFAGFACFKRGGNRNEQIDDPDDQCSKQGAQYGDANASNDELGKVNHECAHQEAHDATTKRRDFFAEDALDSPTNQSDNECKQQGASESADGELGDNPSDNHKNERGNDKSNNMPEKLHGTCLLRIRLECYAEFILFNRAVGYVWKVFGFLGEFVLVSI
jgi:hypothetical protein